MNNCLFIRISGFPFISLYRHHLQNEPNPYPYDDDQTPVVYGVPDEHARASKAEYAKKGKY